MKTVLRNIDVVSTGKIIAVLFAIAGLIHALFYVLFSSYDFGMMGMPGMMAHPLGLLSIIVFPIIGAIVGFIIGAIVAILYNFVASKIGGIKLELK